MRLPGAIVTQALNVTAWVLLHVRPPIEAKRAVDGIARWLPPCREPGDARLMKRALRGGTCLSRSMAVASRLTGAEVVIGVRPGEPRASALHAHAWVEWQGKPLDENDVQGDIIARLPRT